MTHECVLTVLPLLLHRIPILKNDELGVKFEKS